MTILLSTRSRGADKLERGKTKDFNDWVEHEMGNDNGRHRCCAVAHLLILLMNYSSRNDIINFLKQFFLSRESPQDHSKIAFELRFSSFIHFFRRESERRLRGGAALSSYTKVTATSVLVSGDTCCYDRLVRMLFQYFFSAFRTLVSR